MKKEKQEVVNDQQQGQQKETEQGFEKLTDEEMKQVSGGQRIDLSTRVHFFDKETEKTITN